MHAHSPAHEISGCCRGTSLVIAHSRLPWEYDPKMGFTEVLRCRPYPSGHVGPRRPASWDFLSGALPSALAYKGTEIFSARPNVSIKTGHSNSILPSLRIKCSAINDNLQRNVISSAQRGRQCGGYATVGPTAKHVAGGLTVDLWLPCTFSRPLLVVDVHAPSTDHPRGDVNL